MGANKSRPSSFIGRGSTLRGACDDLAMQLREAIGPHVDIRLSLPMTEPPLSPRVASPRYAGPYVAMAIMGDGCDHNVRLVREPRTGMYYVRLAVEKK